MRIKLFKRLDPLTLLPIANNLISETYQMGQAIIRSGETPTFFGFIVQGRCRVW